MYSKQTYPKKNFKKEIMTLQKKKKTSKLGCILFLFTFDGDLVYKLFFLKKKIYPKRKK